MKWREPWKQSIQQQLLPQQLWRRLIRGFLIWLGVFAALVGMYWLVGQVSYRDIPSRIGFIVLFAAGMAALLCSIWLLSPRKIESGPRGIVVTKADEILLIPWQAISSFRLSQTILPGALLLQLHSGEEHRIILPHNAPLAEISREITEMTGAQT